MERTEKTLELGWVSMSQSRMLSWSAGLVLAAVLLYAFAELAGNVMTGTGFVFDSAWMSALHQLASPWLTSAMRLITHSASFLTTAGLALGLSLHWWRQDGRRVDAIVLCVALAGSAALGQGLKALFARPRPQLFAWLTAARGWSFPSGHTLNAVILAGLLTRLVGRRLRRWRRVVLGICIGLWVVLVGLSRVYLGVHYPSDVLASLTIGGLCLLLVWSSHHKLVFKITA